MQNSDLRCRKATLSDNIGVIAKLIHLTDPYIYPAICRDPLDEAWSELISRCIKSKNNVFSLDHITVVTHGDNIVGIAVVIPCPKKISFTDDIAIPKKLSYTIKNVDEGYFVPLAEESLSYNGYNIVNFCIDEGYRGNGIGAFLMEYCINEYGLYDVHLDVVSSNKAAVTLYKKFGFETTNEYMGFSGDDSELPCYHMVRRSH